MNARTGSFFSPASARIRAAIRADCTGEPPGLLIASATALAPRSLERALERRIDAAGEPAAAQATARRSRRSGAPPAPPARAERRSRPSQARRSTIGRRPPARHAAAGPGRGAARASAAALSLPSWSCRTRPGISASGAREPLRPCTSTRLAGLPRRRPERKHHQRPQRAAAARPASRPAARRDGSGSAMPPGPSMRRQAAQPAGQVSSRPRHGRSPARASRRRACRRRREMRWVGHHVIEAPPGEAAAAAGPDRPSSISTRSPSWFCIDVLAGDPLQRRAAARARPPAAGHAHGKAQGRQRRCRRRHPAPARPRAPAPRPPAAPGRSRPDSRARAG